MQQELPKSIAYYRALYVRKGHAEEMLLRDTLSAQRDMARKLAAAVIETPLPDSHTPSIPPE